MSDPRAQDANPPLDQTLQFWADVMKVNKADTLISRKKIEEIENQIAELPKECDEIKEKVRVQSELVLVAQEKQAAEPAAPIPNIDIQYQGVL